MAAKEIKFFRRRPVNSREQFMTGIVFRGFQQKVREQLIDVSAGKCLNEELISEGYAYAQPDEYPLMPAPKPAAWKKPINPNICDRFWAAVTCVSNDCDVFLHRVKDAKKLREISSWLAKAFGNTQPSDADLAARPGDLCIAK